jgi:hypothetical protein
MVLGMGLLPIVPILLLPFVLLFFVLVFPLWVVGLAVTGLALLIVRVANLLARKAGSDALQGAAEGTYRAFRWVLTWGGLAEKVTEKRPAP